MPYIAGSVRAVSQGRGTPHECEGSESGLALKINEFHLMSSKRRCNTNLYIPSWGTGEYLHADETHARDILQDETLVFGLEPVDCVVFRDSLEAADTALGATTLCHTATRALQDNVEIHSVNSSRRIVLETEVDVLGDAEPEAAGTSSYATTAEVPRLQLELC